MSRNGLNVPKLKKHPLWQISHPAWTVSEPSGVKAYLLKRTCLTVLSIWGHDIGRLIQRIHMRSVLVWCKKTHPWFKNHGARIILLISSPHILAAYTPEVLINPCLQQRQPHINIQTRSKHTDEKRNTIINLYLQQRQVSWQQTASPMGTSEIGTQLPVKNQKQPPGLWSALGRQHPHRWRSCQWRVWSLPSTSDICGEPSRATSAPPPAYHPHYLMPTAVGDAPWKSSLSI